MRQIAWNTDGLVFVAAEPEARPVARFENGARIDGAVLDEQGRTLFSLKVLLVGSDAEQLTVKFPHAGDRLPTFGVLEPVSITGAVVTPYVTNGRAATAVRAESVRPVAPPKG